MNQYWYIDDDKDIITINMGLCFIQIPLVYPGIIIISFLFLFLFQDCIQDMTLHLVFMAPYALLGCKSFFSLFLMTLQIWGVRHFVVRHSAEIHMFFSLLDWNYVFVSFWFVYFHFCFFWERSQSLSAILIISHQGYILLTWHHCWTGPWTSGSGSTCQLSPLDSYSFPSFLTMFWKEVTMYRPHLQCEKLWSMSLEVEYLHKLFRILLNREFVFSPLFIKIFNYLFISL